MSGTSLKGRSGSGKMIPSWMRFKGDLFNGWEEDGEPQKVLTDEQRAILKALADPVDNKKVLTDEQWKNQVEEWYGLK